MLTSTSCSAPQLFHFFMSELNQTGSLRIVLVTSIWSSLFFSWAGHWRSCTQMSSNRAPLVQNVPIMDLLNSVMLSCQYGQKEISKRKRRSNMVLLRCTAWRGLCWRSDQGKKTFPSGVSKAASQRRSQDSGLFGKTSVSIQCLTIKKTFWHRWKCSVPI